VSAASKFTLPRLTPEVERDLVFHATAIGFDRPRTARMIGVTEKTLYARYPEILDKGMDFATAVVGGTLYSIATDRKHPNCASAGMFWMKVKEKWRTADSLAKDIDEKREQVIRIIGGLPDPKEIEGTIVEHVMKDEDETKKEDVD
jgi:hypothetical protein